MKVLGVLRKKKFTTEAQRAQRIQVIDNTLFFLCVLCASVVQRGCFPIFLRITGILSHSRSLGTMKTRDGWDGLRRSRVDGDALIHPKVLERG